MALPDAATSANPTGAAHTADAERSPEDPVAVFGRWYAAHETGDTGALAAVLGPDVAVHSLFRSAPVRGRSDAVAHFRRTMSTFPDLSMPLACDPVAASNGAVLAEVTFEGSFQLPLADSGARVAAVQDRPH